MEPKELTLEEFMRYKDLNKEILPELIELANKQNHRREPRRENRRKRTPGSAWKKVQPKLAENWLLKQKHNQNDDEKLYSEMRKLLNKLTDSTFNKLAHEIINLEIDKEEHLKTLVNFIFTKAITEPRYASVYANLCTELAPHYITITNDDIDDNDDNDDNDNDDTDENDNTKQIYFRELLINKCQQMFMEGISMDREIEDTEDETVFRFKEHVIGCMIFIGELFNHSLLTIRIIHSCFVQLFISTNLNKAYSIECLCTLTRTTGLKFSKVAPKLLNDCINKIKELKDSKNLSTRYKFTLMDILDLCKEEKWLN
jgi:translation initiation factor 4G